MKAFVQVWGLVLIISVKRRLLVRQTLTWLSCFYLLTVLSWYLQILRSTKTNSAIYRDTEVHVRAVFSNVVVFSYLVEFVLLAELYTLSPAVVALVQVSSNTSELNQFMFLQPLCQANGVKVVIGIDWCSQALWIACRMKKVLDHRKWDDGYLGQLVSWASFWASAVPPSNHSPCLVLFQSTTSNVPLTCQHASDRRNNVNTATYKTWVPLHLMSSKFLKLKTLVQCLRNDFILEENTNEL